MSRTLRPLAPPDLDTDCHRTKNDNVFRLGAVALQDRTHAYKIFLISYLLHRVPQSFQNFMVLYETETTRLERLNIVKQVSCFQ
jgi:hypothetical protein